MPSHTPSTSSPTSSPFTLPPHDITDKHSIFDTHALEAFRKEHKLQPYRIKQIYHAIFVQQCISFDEMTTLSKELRTLLDETFYITSLRIETCSEGDDTTKFLFRLQDDKIVESVVMFHFHEATPWTDEYDHNLTSLIDGKKLNRLTVCISSQVGCAVNCVFCVTGKLGFWRNLTYYEIIEQVLIVNAYLKHKLGRRTPTDRHKVRNIVFMWMGEPFLNYPNVSRAARAFIDQQMFGLSRKHVTISTSGIVPAIYKMVEEDLPVMLAFSLHSPDQALREQLIPTIAKKYTLTDLMTAIDHFTQHTGKRLFYEYIMIKKTTDTEELAHKLGKLLRNRNGHLNLIPYNENPAIDLSESDRDQIVRFKDIVVSYGVTTTIRNNHGRGIKGACGQLGYEVVRKYKDELAAHDNLVQRERSSGEKVTR